MDWLTFVSNVLGNLAWPIVVLVIAITHRSTLRGLIERVRELTAGGSGVSTKFDPIGRALTDVSKELAGGREEFTDQQGAEDSADSDKPFSELAMEAKEVDQRNTPVVDANSIDAIQDLIAHGERLPSELPVSGQAERDLDVTSLLRYYFDYGEIEQLALQSPHLAIMDTWRRFESFLRAEFSSDSPLPPSRVNLIDLALKREWLTPREYRALGDLRRLRNEVSHSVSQGVSVEQALLYADLVRQIITRIGSARSAAEAYQRAIARALREAVPHDTSVRQDVIDEDSKARLDFLLEHHGIQLAVEVVWTSRTHLGLVTVREVMRLGAEVKPIRCLLISNQSPSVSAIELLKKYEVAFALLAEPSDFPRFRAAIRELLSIAERNRRITGPGTLETSSPD